MRKFKNILILGVAMVATMMFFQGRASAAEYVVPEGSIYWESSWDCGTGKHAKVSAENPYTADIPEEGLSVKIDGYSILNKDGSILESYFNNGTALEEVPPIHNDNRMMLHIWSEKGYRLGWIDAQYVKPLKKSRTEIREITIGKEDEWLEKFEPKGVDKITSILQESLREDENIPRQAYVLGDFSGSMADFYEDVLEKVEDFSGEKFVFGGKLQRFSSGMDVYDYDINPGSTDIANAFNELSNVEENSHIYLLSDLEDNSGTPMQKNEDFVGEISIVYYPGYTRNFYDFIEVLREAFPNATLTGF